MRGYFYEKASDRADRIWAWTFKNNRTPPHFHSALEFIFCIKGSMSVFLDKTHQVLHEGDICFIPANCVHENKQIGENVIVSLVEDKNVENKILQVLTYINQHYKEKLSLEMLAEKFHYSPKYFSDFFNKNTGCSLTTYINNLRVKNVLDERQKRENRESISTLALENGFGCLATFYRALKKYNSTSDSNIYG